MYDTMEFNGQALQDKFVLNITEFKRNGTFVEIGSNDPIVINNTYLLEKGFDWTGVMVEYNKTWEPSYKEKRPGSIHIMEDATNIDYPKVFADAAFPSNIDYLQIDLEVNNGSTFKTLQNLDANIFDNYKFRVVTFEHDIYHTNFLNTRQESRNIFEKRGYLRVFSDVTNNGQNPFEDWYVHPELVNMGYVKQLMTHNDTNNTNSRKINYNI